ncbi:thiamine pyrophosphate-dependent enzyme [Nocardia sp. NPDC051052]|uniref:thiamine pyrophosphate-dependent enzyme n=1 Tax=Nocardia sp. NPDC051052 TaxID=3364322 RepID=UPI0037902E8B
MDFAEIATGYGISACTVGTPSDLADALEQAFGTTGPHLIRVPSSACSAAVSSIRLPGGIRRIGCPRPVVHRLHMFCHNIFRREAPRNPQHQRASHSDRPAARPQLASFR